MSNKPRYNGLPDEWMLLVSASVNPAVEDAWNTWYDRVHLPEILACPGFEHARRYVTTDKRGQRSYQTIYRLSTDDAVRSAEFTKRRGWAQFEDDVEATVRLFHAIGDRG